MGSIDLPKSPNVFHPEKPSAVGSRNSLAQEHREQQVEVDVLLEEEVDKVMNHITSRLPKEVLDRLDVMGGLKEKLYNYFNQNYQNMFNRYITTTEDEMVKKVRNFIDKEESKSLARYTPKEIAEILDQVGGPDKFNTGEIEKSIVNMYGHLQGHIQRGVNDLENLTNSLLRQKTDVGAFIRGENAYSIVKCAFKDNIYKPKTVADVKLSVNILDSELISPIFHYQVTVEYLIKELLANHIVDEIDREIDRYRDTLLDEGAPEPSDSEIIFEKFKRVENYTDDDKENPNSKRFSIVAKKLMERVEGLRAEISPESFDQLNIRENLKKVMDIENIRNRGYNTAVNSITAILDTSKMGYQYIENLKNARELQIREYEDMDAAHLPDERYSVKLKYYDNAQLIEERMAYDKQMAAFEVEIKHLWDVLHVVYESSKNGLAKMFGSVKDFNDLSDKMKNKIKNAEPDAPEYDKIAKHWDEITFVNPDDTVVEQSNKTYLYEKEKLSKQLIIMKDKLQKMYEFKYPIERRVMEDRLVDLESKFHSYEYRINPYHIQPGLLLDLDITSIKRKKATLDGMANVLNEFLHGVSKGFQDAAFASFSRRRSTVRDDIAMSFGASADDEEEGAGLSNDYAAMLSGSPEPAPAVEAPKKAPAKRGRKAKGVVDTPAPKKRRGRKPKASQDGLTEI
jgi:hypothetical protein